MPQPGAIMMNAPRGKQTGVLSIAAAHQIPVWRVGDLRVARSVDLITGIQADLLVCACFNRKIPAGIYEAFSLGGVNVHPSLLPDKRGPDPQFWVLKEGTGRTGVTIHRLSQRFDAGPILAQAEVTYPDGAPEIDLDRLTGAAGARLLVNLLPELHSGTAPEMEQEDSRTTYARFPTSDDFRLDLSRPARSAFNFVRGIAGRGVPVLVELDGRTFEVLDVLDYGENPNDLPEPDGLTCWVQFSPGWALLRLEPIEN